MALKPFYNKKYHLGMDPEDVKAGLVAAAGLPTPEAGDAGKAIVVNEDEDGFVLGEAGGGGTYYHHIRCTPEAGTNPTEIELCVIATNDSTPFTKDTFRTWLSAHGYTAFNAVDKYLPINAVYISAGKNSAPVRIIEFFGVADFLNSVSLVGNMAILNSDNTWSLSTSAVNPDNANFTSHFDDIVTEY